MIATPTRRTTAIRLAVFVLLVAVILLFPLPRSWATAWRAKLLDLGHLPLFACVTFFLWSVFQKRWLPAVALASLAACGGEIAQRFVARSGNFDDAVRGVLGSLMAAVFGIALHRPLKVWRGLVGFAALIALAAWPAYDAWPILRDAQNAYQSAPVLADFSTELQFRRFYTKQVSIERGVAQNDRQPSPFCAGVVFYPGDLPTPTLTFRPPFDNWTGYQRLLIDLSVADREAELTLTVVDWRVPYAFDERYNEARRLAPGRHLWTVELSSITAGPKTKPLDISQIRWLQLFIERPSTEHMIYLHRIALE